MRPVEKFFVIQCGPRDKLFKKIDAQLVKPNINQVLFQTF